MERRKCTPEEKKNIVLTGLKGNILFLQHGLEGLPEKPSIEKGREKIQYQGRRIWAGDRENDGQSATNKKRNLTEEI